MRLEPIRLFVDRVNKMANGRSKEMRMSYEEAHKLSLAITYLMADHIDDKNDEDIDGIVIDGGAL